MSYRQLQEELKAYKTEGRTKIRLNSKKVELVKELERCFCEDFNRTFELKVYTSFPLDKEAEVKSKDFKKESFAKKINKSKANKKIATAPTFRAIEKLVNEYFCSSSYEVNIDGTLSNPNINSKKLKLINDKFKVVLIKNKYCFCIA